MLSVDHCTFFPPQWEVFVPKMFPFLEGLNTFPRVWLLVAGVTTQSWMSVHTVDTCAKNLEVRSLKRVSYKLFPSVYVSYWLGSLAVSLCEFSLQNSFLSSFFFFLLAVVCGACASVFCCVCMWPSCLVNFCTEFIWIMLKSS